MQKQTITALALKQACNDYIHVKIASGNKVFFLRSCVDKYSDSIRVSTSKRPLPKRI